MFFHFYHLLSPLHSSFYSGLQYPVAIKKKQLVITFASSCSIVHFVLIENKLTFAVSFRDWYTIEGVTTAPTTVMAVLKSICALEATREKKNCVSNMGVQRGGARKEKAIVLLPAMICNFKGCDWNVWNTRIDRKIESECLKYEDLIGKFADVC